MSNRIWAWAHRKQKDHIQDESDPRTEALRTLRQAEVGLARAEARKAQAVAQKSRAKKAIDLLHERRKENHYGQAIEAAIEAKRGRHA